MALIERSSNPAFGKIFQDAGGVVANQAMTVQGTVNKSLMMFGLLLASALYSFSLVDLSVEGASIPITTIVGGIGGFIVALITIFRPKSSPITAPIYAILEGLFLGGITALFEGAMPGIGIQAIMLTMGTFFTMLFLYKAKIIRVTQKLRSGVMMAMGAIFFVYVVNFIMGMFGSSLPLLHDSGPMGIGISLVIIGVASFMLLLDFDNIEQGAQQGLPKYMEWYSAFALMLTLIWLYLEFLKLLSKLRD